VLLPLATSGPPSPGPPSPLHLPAAGVFGIQPSMLNPLVYCGIYNASVDPDALAGQMTAVAPFPVVQRTVCEYPALPPPRPAGLLRQCAAPAAAALHLRYTCPAPAPAAVADPESNSPAMCTGAPLISGIANAGTKHPATSMANNNPCMHSRLPPALQMAPGTPMERGECACTGQARLARPPDAAAEAGLRAGRKAGRQAGRSRLAVHAPMRTPHPSFPLPAARRALWWPAPPPTTPQPTSTTLVRAATALNHPALGREPGLLLAGLPLLASPG
jgi:hypothetical protein